MQQRGGGQGQVDHSFGSRSTDLKIAMVGEYLRAFTTALRPKFSTLWYIDAFAGTGERTEHIEAVPASLIGEAQAAGIVRHAGSARVALQTNPPFQRLTFIEKDRRHVEALGALRTEYPGRRIEIINGDANSSLQEILRRQNWNATRAVLFLDPYGMEVDWETLRQIQSTKAIDVWYLVSLSGLFRQAAINLKDVDEGKRAAITRMVGTDEWMHELYAPSAQISLLDEIDPNPTRSRGADVLEFYFLKRLRTLFSTVLGPRRFLNDRKAPLFALFFLLSNDDPRAVRVATNIAGHILKVGNSSHVRPR